jgi:hypothetical protein
VSDENYILSKLDINYDNLTREKIDELVWINKEMREAREWKQSESSSKSAVKKSISQDVIKEFGWVPSKDEFLNYVKNNRSKFEEAWLTWNATWLKSFYTSLRLEKARSEWEVVSILGSADMEFIFNERLKQYYDANDKAWFKKEFDYLYEKWVIKSKDWFNTWLKKNVLNKEWE